MSEKSHGKSGTANYCAWKTMRQRCINPDNSSWKYYGGRGIFVCDRWNSFENFWADMGPTHQEGLTIERIDTNDGYYPENCRWATYHEQRINQRRRRLQVNNRSGITGTYWDAIARRWKAAISVKGKMLHCGSFIFRQDAVSARLEAERQHYGTEYLTYGRCP